MSAAPALAPAAVAASALATRSPTRSAASGRQRTAASADARGETLCRKAGFDVDVLLGRPVGSTVWLGGRRRPDWNGFTTALAARAWRLAGHPVPPAWLDQLQACRAGMTGFTFWPVGREPRWAPMLLPDTDDTSVMAVELLRAGRLSMPEARRLACRGVAAHRIACTPRPGPVWPRSGMFATWHRPGARLDLVDCTASANALALLAATGLLRLRGVRETVEAIASGVEWAAGDEARLVSLSPFYPEPDELRRAVEHAVLEGCALLEPVAAALGSAGAPRPEAAVWSSPYGLLTWHSRELHLLRRAADLTESG